MTVSGPQPTAKSAPVKWEGVSFINNIEYSNDGMQVWRAYGIGCGKFLSWNNFCQASRSPLSHLNKLADNASSRVSFETVKARQRSEQITELASATERDSDEGPALPMGWALKSSTVTRKNLTAAQKTYLTEVFQEGERTGQKADPSNISKAMRRAKHSDGSSIFGKDDFLTPLQIAGFFFSLDREKAVQRKQ